MPGDPRQCRLNAARCLALAKRVRKPETRQLFIEMAETWNQLASLTECDQPLFQAISEIGFDEPYDALPNALRLRLGNTPRRPSRRGQPLLTHRRLRKKSPLRRVGLGGCVGADVTVAGRAVTTLGRCLALVLRHLGLKR